MRDGVRKSDGGRRRKSAKDRLARQLVACAVREPEAQREGRRGGEPRRAIGPSRARRVWQVPEPVLELAEGLEGVGRGEV